MWCFPYPIHINAFSEVFLLILLHWASDYHPHIFSLVVASFIASQSFALPLLVYNFELFICRHFLKFCFPFPPVVHICLFFFYFNLFSLLLCGLFNFNFFFTFGLRFGWSVKLWALIINNLWTLDINKLSAFTSHHCPYNINTLIHFDGWFFFFFKWIYLRKILFYIPWTITHWFTLTKIRRVNLTNLFRYIIYFKWLQGDTMAQWVELPPLLYQSPCVCLDFLQILWFHPPPQIILC